MKKKVYGKKTLLNLKIDFKKSILYGKNPTSIRTNPNPNPNQYSMVKTLLPYVQIKIDFLESILYGKNPTFIRTNKNQYIIRPYLKII